MLTNDILRRVRYAIDLSDAKMLDIMALGGQRLEREQLLAFLQRDDETGFERCPDVCLAAFLNGLIVHRRGARGAVPEPEQRLNNNQVLKKLRIAFKLEESDLVTLLQSTNLILGKNELSALFRKPGHKNYRECGDQLLRRFLTGLTQQLRPEQLRPE